MSLEGSHVSPESSMDLCEKEKVSNSETEDIPEWSLNVETCELLQEGHCTYNAEEQSLVWPPMLLMCSDVDSSDKLLDEDLKWVRNMLATEGVQANSVAEIKHVCCEGNTSYHLFVLPSTGLSFAAAKVADIEYGLGFSVFYPSLKDVLDIKNGRVPEFSRRGVEGLKYHGMPRQAWIDLAVDLVRDDGICVGRGVCEKFEPTDYVNEELLGEIHVGVRVLEVVDALLPSHWKGSLRRWRTTHVLCNGVSLFECLRQYKQAESEDFIYKDGPESAAVAQAQGLLRDQSISSVFPVISISKDLNEFDHLSATYAMTCRNAMDDIERNTFKSDSEGPSLYDGKSFATNFDIDESLRKDEIEKIAKDTCKKRKWMKHLGTIHSSRMARDVVKRLKVLQKLTVPVKSSTLISSMIKKAEEMEIGLLNSIGERVKRENKRKMAMAGFDSEMESFILRRRREQLKELLQELANINARHFCTVEGLVLGKFKFLNNTGRSLKETESVHQWLAHHTAKATDEEKKKWEEQVAMARMEEQKKWEEEVAKARNEEKKKWEEQLEKARREQKKCEEVSAKVMTELAVARQELADQKEAMPRCAICFEALEGTIAKCGQQRSRGDVVLRKRACFSPCMHSSMCLDCAVEAWEKFKRCPVCSTPCHSKPQPISSCDLGFNSGCPCSSSHILGPILLFCFISISIEE